MGEQLLAELGVMIPPNPQRLSQRLVSSRHALSQALSGPQAQAWLERAQRCDDRRDVRLAKADRAAIGVGEVNVPEPAAGQAQGGGVIGTAFQYANVSDTRLRVFAGRPAREKNIDSMVAAVERLGAPYKLLLVGAGKDEKERN